MAMVSQLVYGNDMAYSTATGWSNDAYRQITLAKPATGDLLTWLEANAVRLPLTGTWVWNSGMLPSPSGTLSASGFTSNGNSYTSISFSSDGKSLLYDSTTVATLSSASNLMEYTNEAYRTITFTSPVKYEGNEDFVKWFTANTKPLPAKGKTLNEYTWNEISRISLADKATEYGFKVGDTKQVHLSGTAGGVTWNNDYWVYIIGINHNEVKEGKGIVFQGFKTAQSGGIDICLIGSTYLQTSGGFQMNTSNTNGGGWNGSYAYNTQCPQIKAILPSDLQAVIRTTKLYTDNTGNSSTSASDVTANDNQVYYLSEYEVFGNDIYGNANEPSQQAQYDYYAAGNSKVKYRSNDTEAAALWRLRSPYHSNNIGFCWVSSDGSDSSYRSGSAYYSAAAAPCFKV